MKILGVVLTTLLAGFVAFQNCQQAPHPNDLDNAAAVDTNAVSKSLDLANEKISDISFSFLENTTVVKPSGSYSVGVNKNLKISLPSGKMVLTSDLDDSSSEYCLTETLTNELVKILKSAKICRTGAAAEGKVCTQVYKLPYATLVTEKATYELGSATDGCGSNSVDLCGESASLLQGFYASLKTNYKSFSCH